MPFLVGSVETIAVPVHDDVSRCGCAVTGGVVTNLTTKRYAGGPPMVMTAAVRKTDPRGWLEALADRGCRGGRNEAGYMGVARGEAGICTVGPGIADD